MLGDGRKSRDGGGEKKGGIKSNLENTLCEQAVNCSSGAEAGASGEKRTRKI